MLKLWVLRIIFLCNNYFLIVPTETITDAKYVDDLALLVIQFSISHLFGHCSNIKQIYLTHRILSYATSLGQSGPGSNGNEGGLHISQSSLTITWFIVISGKLPERILSLCRDAVGLFYSSSWQGCPFQGIPLTTTTTTVLLRALPPQ